MNLLETGHRLAASAPSASASTSAKRRRTLLMTVAAQARRRRPAPGPSAVSSARRRVGRQDSVVYASRRLRSPTPTCDFAPSVSRFSSFLARVLSRAQRSVGEQAGADVSGLDELRHGDEGVSRDAAEMVAPSTTESARAAVRRAVAEAARRNATSRGPLPSPDDAEPTRDPERDRR